LVLHARERRSPPSYDRLIGGMFVRHAEAADLEEWLSMRAAPWAECRREEHLAKMRDYISGACLAAFVAGHEHLEGFIETSLRPLAKACATDAVGYIEGIDDRPGCRRRGTRRALMAAAEEWAISRGCTEMASDCLLDNSDSERFHRKVGYSVVERLIHFRRSLSR
jgi:aminoglycoside 6'-N-acetyltransferase I